jgi:hypothetical protein
MSRKSPLTLIKSGATPSQPPRPLGPHGAKLWRSVQREHHIDNIGGKELLAQACAALDRAEALREQIDKDGELLCVGSGIKDHPGLKHELAARAFITRTLVRLGLTQEQIGPIGRPGHGIGITWRQLQHYNDEPEGDGA